MKPKTRWGRRDRKRRKKKGMDMKVRGRSIFDIVRTIKKRSKK